MDDKEKGGKEDMQKMTERKSKTNITVAQRDKMINDILKRRRKVLDRLSKT